MHDLKLVALDAEDLEVMSALVQDAVLKVEDLEWRPREHRFLVAMNRFAWETCPEATLATKPVNFERRRACLHFDRVLKVRSARIARERPETVLELLAVTFRADEEGPAGEVELVFAGGGAVRLTVECLEAQLADLGAAWATKTRPAHDVA